MSLKVLVAGGAGYIGSHVAKALAQAGHYPVVYDNLASGDPEFVKWGPFIEGDVADHGRIVAAVSEHEIDAAIYFAGFIEVGESVHNSLKYYDNNVARACNFLRALNDTGVRTLVFSSSAAVYGEPEKVPIPEEHPKRPVNPYGRTKYFVEEILADLSAAGVMRTFALRYFNAAGADAEGEIGEDHDPEPHLIPRACLALLGRIAPLHVHGTDYPTPDGTAVRDFVHVDDLALAHVMALERLKDGDPGGALNVGTGHGHSVLEVLEAVARAAGRDVPHILGPRRQGDAAVLVADPSKARRCLGWSAQFSGLDEIVVAAWNWHRRRHGKD